jgi:hypothetical protein
MLSPLVRGQMAQVIGGALAPLGYIPSGVARLIEVDPGAGTRDRRS